MFQPKFKILFLLAFDLDVVKLTAQFVARNGRQFLTNLMNREQRNYQVKRRQTIIISINTIHILKNVKAFSSIELLAQHQCCNLDHPINKKIKIQISK
jgi:hypothetical protein